MFELDNLSVPHL